MIIIIKNNNISSNWEEREGSKSNRAWIPIIYGSIKHTGLKKKGWERKKNSCLIQEL